MTTVTVIIVVLVVVLLAAAATMFVRNRRRAELQHRFGPEYDRVVEQADSRKDAENHLAGLAQRRDELTIRDLDATERARYDSEWESIQTRFVDEPGPAVDAANGLIKTVMRERGYPVDDFNERADLVAVDHPDVVQHYRDAHAAHERHRSSGGIETEDLRQSFVHYRALFAALVQKPERATTTRNSTDRNGTDRDDAGARTADSVTPQDPTYSSHRQETR